MDRVGPTIVARGSTSQPGLFVAGDVRHGSIKRVASAVAKAQLRSRWCTVTWLRWTEIGNDNRRPVEASGSDS
jgi:NADPH-dependent glutamate synthase beta subunit-like oxidoreductase